MAGLLTFINDILLDWSTEVGNPLTFEVTNEPIQSTEISSISTHVRRLPRTMELEVFLEGSDREARYQQIETLANSKSVVTLVQQRIFDNLIITDLQQLGMYENVIKFRVKFSQLNIAYTAKVSKKAAKVKSVISKVKKKGKAGTSTEEYGPKAYPSVLWLKQ